MMMKRRNRLMLVFLVVAAGGAFLGYLRDPVTGGREQLLVPRETTDTGNAQEQLRAQSGRTRIWRERTLRYEHSLGTAPGPSLSVPVEVRVTPDETVYVLDWGDKSVKKYSSDGRLLTTYGGTAGQGPGESVNPTDFDVDVDGSVWMCDPVNGLITVFAADGTVERTIRPGRPPHRLALLGDSGYVVIASPAGGRLFTLYRRNDDLILTCGTVMENQAQLSIALDGRLSGTPTGRFAYCAYRAGLLGIFNPTMHPPLLFVHTIDFPGLPPVLSRQSATAHYLRVDPSAPVVSRNVSIVGDEVHVLSGTDKLPESNVMDVYDGNSGRYRYSYTIPGDAGVARVHGQKLYTIADTTVTIWSVTTPL
jgi:hypothetical protein